jgi:hypothetical protein
MMARKVTASRPPVEREASADVELQALDARQAMRLLEPLCSDDPPRRMSTAGAIVVGCLVAAAFIVALSFVAQTLGVP